jgi:hypothetical protein
LPTFGGHRISHAAYLARAVHNAQSQREMRKSTTWNKVEQYLDSQIGILPYLRSVFAGLLLPAPKLLALILFNRI